MYWLVLVKEFGNVGSSLCHQRQGGIDHDDRYKGASDGIASRQRDKTKGNATETRCQKEGNCELRRVPGVSTCFTRKTSANAAVSLPVTLTPHIFDKLLCCSHVESQWKRLHSRY